MNEKIDKNRKDKDDVNEVKFVESQLITPTSKLTSFNYEETPITEIVNQIILDAIRQKHQIFTLILMKMVLKLE